MESNVKVKIDAIDNTKSTFASVSKNLEGVEKGTSSLTGSFSALGKTILTIGAAYQTVRRVYDATALGITIAADMETAEIGLTTLLGSADEARETVARLKQEAARTPFELPGLTQAAQLLTSVTKDGNRSIDIIMDIGEGLAAMGKGQVELDRIIVNLQQIASVGRATSIDIKQFAFAGLPVYEMLAETTGKTGEELAKFIEEGGVTFDVLTEMFDKANDAGGRFHNAFVNQAGSFNQAASNMKDSFGLMMADMVEKSGLFDGLTASMVSASGVMGNWQGIAENVRTSFSQFFSDLDERTLLITHIREVFAHLATVFKETLKPALDELWLAFQPLMPYLQALAAVIGAGLVVMLHAVVAAFGLTADVIARALAGLTLLVTYIIETATFAFRTLENVVKLVAAVFTGDWGGAIEAVKNQIADLIDWVGDLIDMFERAIELASEIGGGSIDFIKKVLPGRAVGGPVAANQPYIVGERGAELFVPNQAGTIIPHNALAGMAMGGGPNIIFNISGTFLDDRSAARRLSEAIMSELRGNSRL